MCNRKAITEALFRPPTTQPRIQAYFNKEKKEEKHHYSASDRFAKAVKMLEGSCVCAQVRYHIDVADAEQMVRPSGLQLTSSIILTGKKTSLCHCRPCRKISGSTRSLNLTIPEPVFTLKSGQLKSVKLKHIDEGFDYSLFFCENCGSPIYAKPHFLEGKLVIQVGTIDNVELLQNAPSVELNVRHRLGWAHHVVDAEQREGY